jgi:stringent starvation protein B
MKNETDIKDIMPTGTRGIVMSFYAREAGKPARGIVMSIYAREAGKLATR